MAPLSRPQQRNVRSKVDVSGSEDEISGPEDEYEQGAFSEEDGSEDADGAEEHEEEGESDGGVEQQMTHVSFGALKQAQDALSRKRKRGSETNEDQEEKLNALRERLREIKAKKTASGASKPPSTRKSHDRAKVTKADEDQDEEDDASDSDSAPSEEGAPTGRSSKHAPTAQSTRHQVSRKRTVIEVPKRHFRDPRFDAIGQNSAPSGNSEKAYSFLYDYQKSEIAELKAALKRTKSEDEKEILGRKINSMENRLKAKEAREKEQEVLRKHRKEEREKVEQGKTPYYLKKKDLKEKVLVEKFKGMKGKEREKLIEKRRRKESQREKKRMPTDRRMAG
jgi:ribosomal RNA-processing protein 36